MKYGRYEIVKEIGRGSMGVVFEAYDPNIERPVALKVLREDRVTNQAFVERFIKEAKAIGRLSHPNIVTVYDVGQDHGTIYIAMEFLTGTPLNKIIEKKGFSVEETIDLGIQIAEVLDRANKKGIVHRDIKPSNIILMEDGQVKITDFGIAHIEDSSSPQLTQVGEILGTPTYMAPEQVTGGHVDGRADIFSLGCILYELITGQRPFGGSSLTAVLRSVTQDNPEEPVNINPQIPEALSSIIMKCLKKNPNERFQTGGATLKALKDCLQEKEVPVPEPFLFEVNNKSKKFYLKILMSIILICIVGGVILLITPKKKLPPILPKSIAPIGEKAILTVKSVPNGADIFVDGQFKGKAPQNIEMPLGKHEVKLTLSKYYDWEAQIQLKEQGEFPLDVELVPIE
ncbi:MAG: protein kinase domain-containing protein [bacterium]